MNPSISAAERRWVLGFGLVVMLLLSLPYVLGFLRQGEDWVFTGFLIGVEDGNTYFAKMMRGYVGDWLFRTPYTAFPQNGALVYLPYILLGKLTSAVGQHSQMLGLYHLFRVVAGLFVFLATYDFLALFLGELHWRRWGLALATLGGGLGWLILLLGGSDWFGALPLDFYSPESFGFLALFTVPHLALGRALLLWGMTTYISTAPDDQPTRPFPFQGLDRSGLRAGLLWLLLGLVQPLFVVVAWAVVGAHLGCLALVRLWQRRVGTQTQWRAWRRFLRRALWAVLLSSPLVLYTAIHFYRDPFLRAWTGQNILPSPHPLHYLLAYGLLLPLVILAAARMLRAEPLRAWLPLAWLLVTPFLIYAPLSVQRRFAEGLWVAILALALYALKQVGGRRRLFAYAYLSLLFLTTLFLFIGALRASWYPAAPVFRPADEVAAFENLRSIARDGELVLADYQTGNALPAWTPQRVLIGHGPESIDLAALEPRVAAFFTSQTPDSQRLALIDEFSVRYLFWGPYERALGSWGPAEAPFLSMIYQEGEYSLYEVQK